MFKLPVCPYCGTVYHYGDVIKNKEKTCTCYHCKGKFKKTRLKGYIFLFLIVTFITVFINILVLNLVSEIINSAVVIFVISVCAVIIAMLLTPFFVSYKPIKGEKAKTIPENTILRDEIQNKKVKRSVKNRMRKEDRKNIN